MHFACASIRRNYGGVAILYNSSEAEVDENDSNDQNNPSVIVGLSSSEEDKDLDTEGRIIAKIFPSFVLVSVYTPHSGVGELKRLEFRV